ncbi:hypothetical protein [Streptomyces sp. NPDC058486]|uniref:hypothetical protein n=1 Tax=unclassified Streptomyces TaxID=2593676 RepID=UPI003659C032
MLSDDDVLAAVRRSLGGDGAYFPAQGARITRHLLVEGRIVRCMETRKETQRFHKGARDLSALPEYDVDLDRHPIPAPDDPEAGSTLRLVRRGSVDPQVCTGCTNGRRHCERCQGGGDLVCRKYTPCEACAGIDCCLSCDGTGTRAREAAARPEGEQTARVRCRPCGAEDVACPKCRGLGKRKCPECGATGFRPCPDCRRKGTVDHDFCGGTGRFVRWTEGVIARTPLVDELKESSGLSGRAFGWTNESDAWGRVDAEGEEAVPADDTDEKVAAYLKPRLQVHAGEVGRRIGLRHLSLARVTHIDHRHRVYVVIPGPTAPRVLPLRSGRRIWQLVGIGLLVLAGAAALFHLLG